VLAEVAPVLHLAGQDALEAAEGVVVHGLPALRESQSRIALAGTSAVGGKICADDAERSEQGAAQVHTVVVLLLELEQAQRLEELDVLQLSARPQPCGEGMLDRLHVRGQAVVVRPP
jgi:hypothetical protein